MYCAPGSDPALLLPLYIVIADRANVFLNCIDWWLNDGKSGDGSSAVLPVREPCPQLGEYPAERAREGGGTRRTAPRLNEAVSPENSVENSTRTRA